ncbi:MAG: hypothetical protein AVDCRST_MAG04-1663, partial [uncultured Acetobacteraceae bacterium]
GDDPHHRAQDRRCRRRLSGLVLEAAAAPAPSGGRADEGSHRADVPHLHLEPHRRTSDGGVQVGEGAARL